MTYKIPTLNIARRASFLLVVTRTFNSRGTGNSMIQRSWTMLFAAPAYATACRSMHCRCSALISQLAATGWHWNISKRIHIRPRAGTVTMRTLQVTRNHFWGKIRRKKRMRASFTRTSNRTYSPSENQTVWFSKLRE